jgi:hypothetical protein
MYALCKIADRQTEGNVQTQRQNATAIVSVRTTIKSSPSTQHQQDWRMIQFLRHCARASVADRQAAHFRSNSMGKDGPVRVNMYILKKTIVLPPTGAQGKINQHRCVRLNDCIRFASICQPWGLPSSRPSLVGRFSDRCIRPVRIRVDTGQTLRMGLQCSDSDEELAAKQTLWGIQIS